MKKEACYEITNGPDEMSLYYSFGKGSLINFIVFNKENNQRELWKVSMLKLEIFNENLRKDGSWLITARIIKKIINHQEHRIKNTFFRGVYSIPRKIGNAEMIERLEKHKNSETEK